MEKGVAPTVEIAATSSAGFSEDAATMIPETSKSEEEEEEPKPYKTTPSLCLVNHQNPNFNSDDEEP